MQTSTEGGDLHHVLRNIAIAAGLFLQFGILIWGAAQIKGSVDALQMTMSEVRDNLKDVTQDLVNIKIEHARQDGEIANLRSKVMP